MRVLSFLAVLTLFAVTYAAIAATTYSNDIKLVKTFLGPKSSAKEIVAVYDNGDNTGTLIVMACGTQLEITASYATLDSAAFIDFAENAVNAACR